MNIRDKGGFPAHSECTSPLHNIHLHDDACHMLLVHIVVANVLGSLHAWLGTTRTAFFCLDYEVKPKAATQLTTSSSSRAISPLDQTRNSMRRFVVAFREPGPAADHPSQYCCSGRGLATEALAELGQDCEKDIAPYPSIV